MAEGEPPGQMPETSAQRTLVKSAPELWTEVSDPTLLADHLESFGEVRITRVEPETTVAWEGDTARGTVRLDGSGWGTRVTLTAELEAAVPAPPASRDPEVEAPPAPARRGLWARLLRRPPAEVVPAGQIQSDLTAPPPPRPVDVDAVLATVLDDLGSAHRRRPFTNG